MAGSRNACCELAHLADGRIVGPFQELRSGLVELKLPLPRKPSRGVLDQAIAEALSPTVALERLLAVEVEASTARPVEERSMA